MIFCADLHFDLKTLAVKVSAFVQMCEWGIRNGIFQIVIAGDIFDTRHAVATEVQVAVDDLIEEYANKGMYFFISAGNHDLPKYSAQNITSINHLRRTKNVSVYTEPTYSLDLDFCFIPYIHSIEEFKKEFENCVETNNPKVIVIHQGVDDVKGVGVPDNGLNINYFESVYDGYVIAGDYHWARNIRKFLSPGCLVQDDFGDRDEKKGFWTFIDDKFEFYKLSYPEYIKAEIKSIKDLKDIDMEGNHVWFTTENKRIIKKLKERALEAKALSCRISEIKSFVSSHKETVEVSTPIDMFSKMLDILNTENKETQLSLYQRICINKETYTDTVDAEMKELIPDELKIPYWDEQGSGEVVEGLKERNFGIKSKDLNIPTTYAFPVKTRPVDSQSAVIDDLDEW